MIYSKKNIRKALKKERVKWASIYHGHEVKDIDCPLCDLFRFLNDCRLCPIMNKTGFPKCAGTPFNEWTLDQQNEHGIDISNGQVIRCAECKQLAGKQFNFISSILHEGGK